MTGWTLMAKQPLTFTREEILAILRRGAPPDLSRTFTAWALERFGASPARLKSVFLAGAEIKRAQPSFRRTGGD